MQQGKPLGLAKNVRGGVCPAGRDRTFEGAPLGEEVEGTTKIACSIGPVFFVVYLNYSLYLCNRFDI